LNRAEPVDAEIVPSPASAPPRRAADSWRYHACWLAGALGVLLAAGLLHLGGDGGTISAPWVGRLPELCTFKAQTGISCPGCGLTRSFVALARGDLSTAWRFNPVGLLLFGLLLYQIPYRLVAIVLTIRGIRLWNPSARTTGWTVGLIAAALLVQWVWRMW